MRIMIIKEFKGTVEVSKAFYDTFLDCQSKDPTRYFMNYVYFDGPKHTFVATDGRRIIWHENYDISEDLTGFYELAKIGKTFKLIPAQCDGQFPNWQAVSPDMNILEQVSLLKTVRDITSPWEDFNISGKLEEDSPFICKLVQNIGCILNIEYITKILKHVDQFTAWKNIEKPEIRSILFKIDPDTNYLIMPMQS